MRLVGILYWLWGVLLLADAHLATSQRDAESQSTTYGPVYRGSPNSIQSSGSENSLLIQINQRTLAFDKHVLSWRVVAEVTNMEQYGLSESDSR
jgi:hypothetical protein